MTTTLKMMSFSILLAAHTIAAGGCDTGDENGPSSALEPDAPVDDMGPEDGSSTAAWDGSESGDELDPQSGSGKLLDAASDPTAFLQVCGGPPNYPTCGPTEICRTFGRGRCHGVRFCFPREENCSAASEEVCGCDGQLYDNVCEADLANVEVQHPHNCSPRDGGLDGGGLD